MKSKILLIVAFVALGFSLSAQPLHWTELLFDPLKTSTILKETVLTTDGASSMKYTFTDPGIVLMVSDTFAVTAGQPWNFSVDYLDNDPQGIITARVFFRVDQATSLPNATGRFTTSNTTDSPSWQTLTLPATPTNVPATATLAYVVVRMSPGTPFTAATFYADNIKFFMGAGSTTNLVENPSFENWTTPAFKTFNFAGLTPNVSGVINNTTHKVALTVPYGTDVTALVPTFTITNGVTVKVGADAQVSGTTPNNFTAPVTYSLSVLDAQGVATTQDWEVTVNITPAATGKDITAFSFATPAAAGVVNAGAHTIGIVVPFGTDITALIPTITLSAFATVSPLSGVAQDFTTPKTYTVTAQDLSTQDWVVTVTFGLPKEIITFNFATPAVVGVVGAGTVALTVPYGTNLTALVPTITTSANTTISPLSGVAQDFTTPVTYTVTATADATTKDWIVTVTVGPPSTAKSIVSFSFAGLSPAVNGTVNATAHTVALTVPYVTNLTALIPTITLSPNATVSPLSGVAQDFTTPKTYTVTAQDASTQDWVVTVTKTPIATGKDINTFKFLGLTPAVDGVINPTDHTIKLEVPSGTNVSTLVATFTLSNLADAKVGATAQVSGTTPNDFTNPVTYTVTAQDASTQAWVATVTFAASGQTTIFLEDFENVPRVLKPTFKLIRNDSWPMAVGEERWAGDSCWVITTTNRPEFAGTHVAMSSSYVVMPLTERVDRWMITPSIALGDNSTLSWQALSTTTSGNFPDDYDVVIAPAPPVGTAPTVSYCNTFGYNLLSQDPESWSRNVGNPGLGLATHTINLKTDAVSTAFPQGWFNRNVIIAFINTTDRYLSNASAGGSALAIDNIKVVNSPVSGIDENKNNSLSVSVYPNPSNGKFKVAIQLEKNAIADVKVTDIIGRVIYNNQMPVYAGQNQVDVNLSYLHEGIYLVKTEINGKINVSKIIIR